MYLHYRLISCPPFLPDLFIQNEFTGVKKSFMQIFSVRSAKFSKSSKYENLCNGINEIDFLLSILWDSDVVKFNILDADTFGLGNENFVG